MAVTPTLNPTPPPRNTHKETPLPTAQDNADPHAPLRVLSTVPQSLPLRPPPAPPPRVDRPIITPPHGYPLRLLTWENYSVKSIGEGAVAFQGAIEPNTGMTKAYMQLISRPAKCTWTTAFSNNIGRLAQGGTNIIFLFTSQRSHQEKG